MSRASPSQGPWTSLHSFLERWLCCATLRAPLNAGGGPFTAVCMLVALTWTPVPPRHLHPHNYFLFLKWLPHQTDFKAKNNKCLAGRILCPSMFHTTGNSWQLDSSRETRGGLKKYLNLPVDHLCRTVFEWLQDKTCICPKPQLKHSQEESRNKWAGSQCWLETWFIKPREDPETLTQEAPTLGSWDCTAQDAQAGTAGKRRFGVLKSLANDTLICQFQLLDSIPGLKRQES